jgi:hypothetical protein
MSDKYKDINQFAEGQTVDISGIADMQGIVITRISQSGVNITSKVLGDTIISGKSPACLSEAQREVTITTDEKTQKRTIKVARAVVEAGETEPRGKYGEIMNNLKFPTGSFTAQALADLNEIPYNYASKYCTEYLEDAGFAVKAEGQRGKAPRLFKIG